MFAARGRYDDCPMNNCSQLGMARASTWQGPYVLDAVPVCEGALCRNGSTPDWATLCEDPHQWIEDDGTHHALCNSQDPRLEISGMHAYSRTGAAGTWHFSTEPCYNTSIVMANGSTVVVGSRERPHLLWNAQTGRPSHLYTAVMANDGSDRSWTFAQALKSDDHQHVDIVARVRRCVRAH